MPGSTKNRSSSASFASGCARCRDQENLDLRMAAVEAPILMYPVDQPGVSLQTNTHMICSGESPSIGRVTVNRRVALQCASPEWWALK